ncbi:hypothetical protein P692DRAFT_20821423 [Suillus brevipes Sb2]|nr:hypothetical protein P692DRAFT_20821423 [Suillus brevipes Sb2]
MSASYMVPACNYSSERTVLVGDSEVKRSTLLFESMHFQMLEALRVGVPVPVEGTVLAGAGAVSTFRPSVLPVRYPSLVIKFARVRSRILSLVGDDAKDASLKFCALIIPALCASAIKKSNHSEASQKLPSPASHSDGALNGKIPGRYSHFTVVGRVASTEFLKTFQEKNSEAFTTIFQETGNLSCSEYKEV